MQDTATRILDAAERLFAANGYGATSIRSITREAEVNVAAVHYHFGSKEKVLRGVLDRIAGPINQRRRELLDALDDPAVSDLVEAFIRPDLEVLHQLHRRNRAAARFAGRVYADRSEPMATITQEQFSAIAAQFVNRLASRLEEVSTDELRWRLHRVVAVIVDIFSGYPEGGMSRAETEEMIDRLVNFITPAMEAPEPKGAASNDHRET